MKNNVVTEMASPSQSNQVKPKRYKFFDILENVEEQIEIECFGQADHAQAKELALIITEIMNFPENANVRINGQDLSAEMVACVYSKLTREHVAEVIKNFRKATYEITYIKTYLRTALYNAVFENEARVENEVMRDLRGV